jgi:hypothetical protein
MAATVAVTGTATKLGGLTEAEVVAGGQTIILTVTDDTWVATVGADNAITDALIAGIDSDKAEAAGWDAVVKANMVFGDVNRDSDTVVTITLGAEASFVITADELITITVPGTALTGAAPVVATPRLRVRNQMSDGTPAYYPNSGSVHSDTFMRTTQGPGAEPWYPNIGSAVRGYDVP